jgi:hypothetical protein
MQILAEPHCKKNSKHGLYAKTLAVCPQMWFYILCIAWMGMGTYLMAQSMSRKLFLEHYMTEMPCVWRDWRVGIVLPAQLECGHRPLT